MLRVQPIPDANRLRSDGLRWVPKTNALISVPVVTIHTLGDLYVPFSMEQIFKRRADALGTSNFLVQRAIRGISHCDFTVAEQVSAFDAMVDWEQKGVKPAGDDVLTPATVADPKYGCKFSRQYADARRQCIDPCNPDQYNAHPVVQLSNTVMVIHELDD